MHMQQRDHVERRENGECSIAVTGTSDRPPDADEGSSGPPASFGNWLDQRLKTLYRTVLNEPLPPEMLDLLRRPKSTSGSR